MPPVIVGHGTGSLQFNDAKEGALYCLLMSNVPLVDFLYWAVRQRHKILNDPTSVPGDHWQFRLLQDQSLTDLTEQVSQMRLNDGINGGVFGDKRPSPTSVLEPAQKVTWNDGHVAVLSTSRCSTVVPSSEPAEPPQKASPFAKRSRPSIVAQVTGAPVTKVLAPSSSASSSRAKSHRGSSRRTPEKEGLVDCPDCGRRGQSIFDPSSQNAEGLVFEYFYCRNTECIKGKSQSRYIGWTVRRKS